MTTPHANLARRESNRSSAHDMGTVEADHEPVGPDQESVRFPFGLPGFEECRSFVVLAAQEAPFQWLSSIEGPAAAFLTVDPRKIMPTYRYVLSPQDLDRLAAREDTLLLWLAIVLLDDDGSVAVNLRAPIVINPASMTGHQVMPQNCLYPLRHIIVPASGS